MADSEKWVIQRIYLTSDDYDRLSILAKTIELKPSEALQKIVHAGLLALRENGNRMPLPLRFTLDQNGKNSGK